MDSQLSRLTAALPAPQPAHRFDWAEAETRCGTSLPADYKNLLDAYGPVGFDDFLWLLFPGDHKFLSLSDEGGRIVGEYLPAMDPTIDVDRYQAWGITDNGDYCLWEKTTPNPDDWTVTLTDTGLNRWDRFPDLNVTGFLLRLVERTLESSVMPLADIDLPPTPSVAPVHT
ncbi:hypothetical protein ACIBJI_40020 [Nocardia sp. NPDC050408]|uniref:hypothetical protein n=1 Tax=Nocardia sp. NPDC050408 TaxID=3364319 RepID=UPI00379E8E7D